MPYSLSELIGRESKFPKADINQFFENYVVGELVRNNAYGEKVANLTYYRDTNQKEINGLVICMADGVFPIDEKNIMMPACII
ncbi:MAG: hypothetical protein IJM37_00305 [Lachnospiraceae bacterium]|nr:hypothetical protein [Lachnospiraceae bacterium]